MAQPPEFNPNSYDSVLSRILNMLEEQKEHAENKRISDEKAFSEIMAKQDLTNGRVKSLEVWRGNIKGRITILVGALTIGVPLITFLVNYFTK
jgi:hypothetical protein